jgi:nucleotide-binding universal stress UspA family protein
MSDALPFHRILCALDFSDASQAALRTACELARSTGATVTALHVYELPGHALPPYGFAVAPEVLDSARERMQAALERARLEAVSLGAPGVAAAMIDDTPWHGIVEYARAGGFDLIVVGTHGRSGLRHALLGSVAERVVRHAPCAVLTVHAPTAA